MLTFTACYLAGIIHGLMSKISLKLLPIVPEVWSSFRLKMWLEREKKRKKA